MKPLVSILIPAYNAQAWIADTIQSAIRQTWPNKEIIVVDDGSKDGTLAVARQFEPAGVQVFSQKNQGAAAARNKALSLARGEFIQWLDADDLLAPDKIARQMKIFEDGEDRRILVSSSWGSFYHRPYRAKYRETSLWCDLAPVEWLRRKLNENVYMQTGAWLVSRELTTAAGPWNTEMLGDDDGEYFCRVILACKLVRFVPEARVMYRWSGPASLSCIGHSRKKMEALFHSMRLHIGYVLSLDDSPRIRSACVRYLQTNLQTFHPECPDLVERAQALAKDLGGSLHPVRLSWKFAWIAKPFGWSSAKRTQLRYNRYKTRAIGFLDRILFQIEKTLGHRCNTRNDDAELT